MPATYSDLLRLAKQGTGDNSATWGTVANEQVFELIEEAIAGIISINATALAPSFSLSTANGTSDQARNIGLEFTGTPTGPVTCTVPASSKVYVVRNACSQNIVMSAGGATVTVAPNATDICLVIGNNVRSLLQWVPGVSGPVPIANGGTGQTTAIAARNALLPSQTGQAGKVLQTDGTNVAWGAQTGEVKNQIFLSGTNFTPNVTNTLTLTNTPVAPTSSSLFIFFEAAYQGRGIEYTYNPATGVILFVEPIPDGVAYVEATWISPGAFASTVPDDGSVTWGKLATGLIATVGELASGAANKLVSATNLQTFLATFNTVKGRINVATTSGSTVNLSTAIPAGVTKITIALADVGKSGVTSPGLQLGSGSFQTTGYTGTSSINTTGVSSSVYSDAFRLSNGGGWAAGWRMSGVLTLLLVTGNTWAISGTVASHNASVHTNHNAGFVTLSGVLDRIRLDGGADTFNNGSATITWEF